MTLNDTLNVSVLDPAAGRDAELVGQLTDLVNVVYLTAESGLWREGTTRTTTSELAELIGAGQIVVAARDEEIAGLVHVHDTADDTSEIGMLVADPEQRGTGIGRALLTFAEDLSRARGRRAMLLELLVPRTWRHPSKEFLTAWYGRCGYRLVRTTTLDESYAHLAPLLATPCDLQIHEKPLR